MGRKPIIALAVGIALLVLIAILFAAVRQPTPAITVRHIKRARPLIYGITEAFGVTNHTGRRVSCYPIDIEARKGDVWERCFHVELKPFLISHLGPHEGTVCSFETSKLLPAGRPLRLKMAVQVELKGVSGFIARIKWRLLGSTMSLNPFDRFSGVFSDVDEIYSEEFLETEASQ